MTTRKSATPPTGWPFGPGLPNFEMMTKTQMAWMAPMHAYGLAALEAWADMIEEWSKFTADRIRQETETQRALLGCATPFEVQAVQSAYFHKAMEEYQTEAGKMVKMGQDAAAAMSHDAQMVAA